ncbi:hypothetical protein FB451DRAFT_489613 [Mycena latifolia]|nr:hypothetical protein FB451DRAFT_489613 [Mycena latifolia]
MSPPLALMRVSTRAGTRRCSSLRHACPPSPPPGAHRSTSRLQDVSEDATTNTAAQMTRPCVSDLSLRKRTWRAIALPVCGVGAVLRLTRHIHGARSSRVVSSKAHPGAGVKNQSALRDTDGDFVPARFAISLAARILKHGAPALNAAGGAHCGAWAALALIGLWCTAARGLRECEGDSRHEPHWGYHPAAPLERERAGPGPRYAAVTTAQMTRFGVLLRRAERPDWGHVASCRVLGRPATRGWRAGCAN